MSDSGADAFSGLLMFGLFCVTGLVVLGTSIWVCFDATKIGLRKTGEKPQTGKFHVDMGPFGWMVCCILFWIVAFPMYINRRPGFVRRFQTSLPAQPASAPPPDFEQQLMKLARLKESGVLTEAEFTAKKQEILGFDKKPSIHKIISLFVLLALAGCSASSSPPTEEINKGVNWALSASVGWRDKERNLFESFKITNQYTEKRKDGVACIYDFKAECRVTEKSQTDRFGNWKSVWDQGEGTPKDQSKAYTGTFTLIKKGDKWYRQETVR